MFFIYNDVFCTRFVNFIQGVFFKTTVYYILKLCEKLSNNVKMTAVV